MGVHGLWKLIESAGKPVPVETLDNKVLAVDVSIWLHQLMKGYQASSGANVSNAYLLGLFTRVCKLLFTNIKPVFVFDGGVPQLKSKTIAARQQQRNKAEQVSDKLREQLLKNLLKQKAVGQVLEEIRGQTSPKKKTPDMYELPPLPEAEDSPSEEEVLSSSSEEDVKPFKMKYRDLHSIDVNSADFKALPADMRHDILSDLKETRKQSSWGRIHEMPEESDDFSNYQMSRLLKRRSVQVSLEEAEKEMGGKTLSLGDVETLLTEGGVEINPQLTKRIASDNVTRYIYVRETGLSKSEKEDHLKHTNVPSLSSKHESHSGITIKEEIKDSDLLLDSELVEEVEAIEQMYKEKMEHSESRVGDKDQNLIEVKEENLEFGTEDMFENESTSDGVIIDEMDLVEDNSGLSQNQILAIIKQQNKASETTTNFDGDLPSTSNVHVKSHSENNSSSNSCHTVMKQPEKNNSEDTDSKILDSLYFKLNKDIKSIISKKKKATIARSIICNTAENHKIEDHIPPVDLSALASNSSDSEVDTENNLPCAVSELIQPMCTIETTSRNNFESPKNTNQSPESANKLGIPANLSSSESDDEFIEVPQDGPGNKSPESNLKDNIPKGLRIEIQPQKHNVEEDIFADIFLDIDKNEESNKSLVNNKSIVGLSTECKISLSKADKHLPGKISENIIVSPTKKNQIAPYNFETVFVSSSNKNTLDITETSEHPDISTVKNNETVIIEDSEKVSPLASESLCPSNIVSENNPLPVVNNKNLPSLSLSEYNDDKPSSSTSLGNEDSDDSEKVDDPVSTPAATIDPSIQKQDKPKRILNTKQLEKLQDILETKEKELVMSQNREDRMATSLTDQMYQEAQELLRLFGVPYVVAPMEAEAQCAFLDLAGLTQGTITDDSDIWLFGANKVYKNFFDQKKFVMEFQANDIQHYFRLSRGHLVLLALLVGSDYTVGLQGVGAVTAIEILATFPPPAPTTQDPGQLLSSLEKFKQWFHSQRQTHQPLAKKLKNVDLIQGFPSVAVVNAYLQPMVDDSLEPFSWGQPDLPGLRDYAERKFGWSRSRTDQILQPVLNRMSQKTSQLTLHTFFGAVPNITGHREQMSRRVQSAVHRLEGGGEDFQPVAPRERQTRGRGRGRGRGSRGRGDKVCCHLDNHESCKGDGCNASTDIIPQKEKDKMEALKRKKQAIEIFKSKKRKGVTKRKNIRQTKAEADLSESSSDDN